MTLAEAKEILTRWQRGNDITSFDDVNAAARLAIEALERILQLRQTKYDYPGEILPSETLELKAGGRRPLLT